MGLDQAAIVQPRGASHKSPGIATATAGPPAAAAQHDGNLMTDERVTDELAIDELVTGGTLLGGAVRYAQPRHGYRTGIEPIFLAAAVPARAGDRVLEGGTGAGAGLLCLAHRAPGIAGVGVEIEPAMARIATANVMANGAADLVIVTGDVCAQAAPLSGHDRAFDHAFANPPWHDAAGTPPEGALKQRAKQAAAGLGGRWIAALAACLRPRGTLTLILPPHAIPESLDALRQAGCGSVVLFPLWPKPGREPRIALIQAIKGGRADFRLLPGLILHDSAGYTDAAESVLRRGEALTLR
jgi:tRNA1Val (adenine37-N6)-methyltransferase